MRASARQRRELLQRAASFSVPEDKRETWVRLVRFALHEASRNHGQKGEVPRRSKVIRLLEGVRDAEPSEAVKQLQERSTTARKAAALLQCACSPENLADWLQISNIGDRSPKVDQAITWAQRDLRVRGNAKGKSKNPAFSDFVEQFYLFTIALGGDPGTCSQHGSDPVKGRFTEVIRKFVTDNCLPTDFVPTEGSIIGAYRNAKREWDLRHLDLNNNEALVSRSK